MKKTAGIILSVFLITSQWLVLAHATDHLLGDDRTHCTICALREHQDDHAIITALPPLIAGKPAIAGCNVQYTYSLTPCFTRSIRAPPLSS